VIPSYSGLAGLWLETAHGTVTLELAGTRHSRLFLEYRNYREGARTRVAPPPLSRMSRGLDGDVSRTIIGRSRLVGELHDIAVLDHGILGAHFLVHRDHHFSILEKLHQGTNTILVRFNEFPDRGRR